MLKYEVLDREGFATEGSGEAGAGTEGSGEAETGIPETETTTSTDTTTPTTETETTPETEIETETTPETETETTSTIELTEEEILPIAVRIFNESHVIHLLWFVVIYLVVYVFFGEFLKRSGDTSPGTTMSRIFDYVVFFWAILFTIYLYYSSSPEVQSNVIKATMDWTIEFYDDPLSIFSVSLFMISFYAIVMILRMPMGSGLKPYSVELIESKGWILIASLLICYVFKYLLGINLMDIFRDPSVSKLWSSTLDDQPVGDEPEEEIPASETGEEEEGEGEGETPESETVVPKEEVFNVAAQTLTYKDAQAVCKSYDARLATYDEVEQSYQNGGEWCNYGWSENQMAFFPTQKATWEELQKQPRMKNRCGRPGVNGGFIPNDKMKLGANCFGVKPDPTASEESAMNTQYENNAPMTVEERILEEKSKYWKENRDKLSLNAFNRKKWSAF